MEIYQLRAFLTVARTSHLTRAATELGLTQSAVSKQIASLEQELGVPLFERTSSGTKLNKYGKVLLPQALKTYASAMEIHRIAHEIAEQCRGSNIASSIKLRETMISHCENGSL